ncbi:uncharacterized protein [Asterias amurensis]|uniref:uncharacterized protein isoform X2 n=1 Tax=Asterias amurensis TaxID=7602 RepID=UPI003AB211A6
MADDRAWWSLALMVGFRLMATSLAAEGDVKLIGSDRGIEGKLLIEHDAVWRTVCYDGWTHTDSDTVCKQLGFSKGAMITRASTGEFTGSAGSSTVKAPGCTEANSRLSDCPGFTYQEDFTCSAEVDLSCYVDDFIGCHSGNPHDWAVVEILLNGVDSIEYCVGLCRFRNYEFAAISGNRCLCGRESGVKGPLVSTVNCASPCGRDATEACGTSDGASTEFYTIWPTSVGQSNGALSTANGCIYSREFPGRYSTINQVEINIHTVSLPTAKYVALKIPVFDLYAMDRLEISQGGMVVALTAPGSPQDVVIPFQAQVSGFDLRFTTDASSPTDGNFGFVVCYESLDELPTVPPSTPSPTTPSTAPPTIAPTNAPTNAQTNAPTDAPSAVPSMAGPMEATTAPSDIPMPTEMSTVPPTDAATTIAQQPQGECPLHHGALVEQRRDRDGNNLLLLNTGNPFNCTGFISGLTYFSASLGSFKVSVWSVNDTDKYILQEEIDIEGTSQEISTVNLSRSVWLPVYPGNIMGVSFVTSPFVWSEAATSNGEATQWISWMLNDANPERRDTADGTILDRAYSISAKLRARVVCPVPTVPNSKPTDAIVSFVYEGQYYSLSCKSNYGPPASSSGRYLCQEDGTFDGDLVCERLGIFTFGFTFTQLIICVVVLMLMCLTIFVVCCMMFCCSGRASSNGKKEHLVESGGETDDTVDQSDGNALLVLIDSESGELDNPVPVDAADQDSLPDYLPGEFSENSVAGDATDAMNVPAGDAIDVPAADEIDTPAVDVPDVGSTDPPAYDYNDVPAADTTGTAVIDNPIADESG